jgi:hypothetical protein
VKKALAKPEPSTHGTFETSRRTVTMSAYCIERKLSVRG